MLWSGAVSGQQRTSPGTTPTTGLALLAPQLPLWKTNSSSRPLTHRTWGTGQTRHQGSQLPRCLRTTVLPSPALPSHLRASAYSQAWGSPHLPGAEASALSRVTWGYFQRDGLGDSPSQQGLGGEAGCPCDSLASQGVCT